MSDRDWLNYAIELAARGEAVGEVPVGALLVAGHEILGEGWNCPIGEQDPTAHAEMVAIRKAAKRLGNYRLDQFESIPTTLYVTLEPCIMCAGAILHARIPRVVFGVRDPKAGAVGSLCNVFELKGLPRVDYMADACVERCQDQLKRFFQARRK